MLLPTQQWVVVSVVYTVNSHVGAHRNRISSSSDIVNAISGVSARQLSVSSYVRMYESQRVADDGNCPCGVDAASSVMGIVVAAIDRRPVRELHERFARSTPVMMSSVGVVTLFASAPRVYMNMLLTQLLNVSAPVMDMTTADRINWTSWLCSARYTKTTR